MGNALSDGEVPTQQGRYIPYVQLDRSAEHLSYAFVDFHNRGTLGQLLHVSLFSRHMDMIF